MVPHDSSINFTSSQTEVKSSQTFQWDGLTYVHWLLHGLGNLHSTSLGSFPVWIRYFDFINRKNCIPSESEVKYHLELAKLINVNEILWPG